MYERGKKLSKPKRKKHTKKEKEEKNINIE